MDNHHQEDMDSHRLVDTHSLDTGSLPRGATDNQATGSLLEATLPNNRLLEATPVNIHLRAATLANSLAATRRLLAIHQQVCT